MPRSARRRAAFTLIEMIAVVLLFALMVAMVAPNFGSLSGRRLRDEADGLAARLELARQRATMTGTPHRVALDLDGALYRVEWLASEAEADAALRGEPEPPSEPAPLDLRGDTPLPLAAPREDERSFAPLPGELGKDAMLAEALRFRGVETAQGWVERGEASIAFGPDGSAEWTTVVLEDDAGHGIALDVRPLADTVRVRDADE
jgi:type II secretion system protein H